MTDTGWVTQVEAAELLGVHRSAVPKMIRRGDLTPRQGRPSLSRDDVMKLAAARVTAAEERELRRAAKPVGPRPPDQEHEWLLGQAAADLGARAFSFETALDAGPVLVPGGDLTVNRSPSDVNWDLNLPMSAAWQAHDLMVDRLMSEGEQLRSTRSRGRTRPVGPSPRAPSLATTPYPTRTTSKTKTSLKS